MAHRDSSSSWRWFSLVFGILVPLVVWGFLVLGIRDSFIQLNAAFVLVEISCLGWFLRSGAPSPLAAKLMSAWFYIGTMYAACWSLVCLMGLSILPSDPDRSGAGMLLVIALCLSPFPCVPIYLMAAFNALRSDHRGRSAGAG